MGTMTQFEVVVFDPKTQTGIPIRFLTQQAVEDYLKSVIRHLDGSLDTDAMDFDACREALKYLQVTITLSKIKVPLEDVF